MLQSATKTQPKAIQKRPRFGQQIKARKCVVKRRDYDPTTKQWVTHWEEWPWPKDFEGIYIGYRNVHEGTLSGGQEWDDSVIFHHENTLRVWLIVRDERTNPIHVLPEDVIWE